MTEREEGPRGTGDKEEGCHGFSREGEGGRDAALVGRSRDGRCGQVRWGGETHAMPAGSRREERCGWMQWGGGDECEK
jgi:hypothetical protein